MHRSIPERSGSEPVKEKVGGEAKLKDFELSEDVDSDKNIYFFQLPCGDDEIATRERNGA